MINRDRGLQADADARTMRTAVSSQRGKLGNDGENSTYVFTELRVGYPMPKVEMEEQTEA